MPTPCLTVSGVGKRFGGVKTLTAVSFDLNPGQILGLLGPNGAGKTTIFNVINGIYCADGGSVMLDGGEITNMKPTRIARLGVARTFQVPRTFNNMTIEENLLVPLVRLGLAYREMRQRVDRMLSVIGMGAIRLQRVSLLPDGKRKLLEVARAIMIRPKVLILDEPFAGVSPDVIDLVISEIKALAAEGVGCLAISHDIASLPRLCEDVLVLVEGRVLTSGRLAEVRNDPRVVEAYLGS